MSFKAPKRIIKGLEQTKKETKTDSTPSAASIDWSPILFKTTEASKRTIGRNYESTYLPDETNWDYIQGKLGKNQMNYNMNLLNQDNFQRYWTAGPKKVGYKIYNNQDFDGDEINDYVAVDPSGHVVGFNEKVILPGDKSEYAYKRNYYALPNDTRKKMTYQEYLDGANNIEGYKNLDKYKEGRQKQTWILVFNLIHDALVNNDGFKNNPRLQEKLCKMIVKSIAFNVFFSSDANSSMIAEIVKSSHFKKMLHNFLSNSNNINTVIPSSQAANIILGGYNVLTGVEDATYGNYEQFLDSIHTYQLSAEKTEALYDSILSQKLTKKYIKEHNITPLHIAQNPSLATDLSNFVIKEKEKFKTGRQNSTFNPTGLKETLIKWYD